MAELKPLNGSKTHPPTDHAREALREIERHTTPRQRFNPGVINRLLRGGLIETVMMPSPYAAHKGGDCEHVRITEAGLQELGL